MSKIPHAQVLTFITRACTFTYAQTSQTTCCSAVGGPKSALNLLCSQVQGNEKKMPSSTKGLQRRLNASPPRSPVKSCFLAPRVADLAKKQKPTSLHLNEKKKNALSPFSGTPQSNHTMSSRALNKTRLGL